MNQIAIHRSEEKTHGRTGAGPSRGCMGNRASIAHHKFQRVLPPSRHLAGARRSGPFIRLGWAFTPSQYALYLSLLHIVGEFHARYLAYQSPAPGRFQAIPERSEVHLSVASIRCAPNTPREAMHEVPENRAFGTPDDC